MSEELKDILAAYQGQKGAVIPVLQKTQEKLGFLSPEAITEIARALGTSDNEIYGVATFYSQFRFTRPGKHGVHVCLGTACHVRGGENVLDAVERELDVMAGQTSKDFKFSVDKVACFGSCALAPVVVVDKDVYGRMTTTKIRDILKKYD